MIRTCSFVGRQRKIARRTARGSPEAPRAEGAPGTRICPSEGDALATAYPRSDSAGLNVCAAIGTWRPIRERQEAGETSTVRVSPVALSHSNGRTIQQNAGAHPCNYPIPLDKLCSTKVILIICRRCKRHRPAGSAERSDARFRGRLGVLRQNVQESARRSFLGKLEHTRGQGAYETGSEPGAR